MRPAPLVGYFEDAKTRASQKGLAVAYGQGLVTENNERFEMRVPTSFLKAVDIWRRKQEDLPTRAEAIRRLVELGLKAKAK